MISEKSFSKEWLESFRGKRKRRIDLMILEKMIRALSLVELLKINGIEFTFKGGTSLAILLNKPKRFSIDIDILTKENKDVLEEKLNLVCENDTFLKFEENIRSTKASDIPMAHYKFYYTSVINGLDNYILLDVLFEVNSYPENIESTVINEYLDIEGNPSKVETPSLNSITGDKLTAFAPNTIGILYNANKEKEIRKQLFDLGNLFDEITDFALVGKAYHSISKKEIRYRNLDVSTQDTLSDTISTAILIAQRERNKDDSLIKFRKLQDGIRKFTSFTINANFTLDNAIEAAAKAALIATKIKTKNYDPITPFDKGLGNYLIEDKEYNFLNRLVRLPNRALFYWSQAVKLLK